MNQIENSPINAHTLGATSEEIDTRIQRARDNREIDTRRETIGSLTEENTAMRELLREYENRLCVQVAQQNRNRHSLQNCTLFLQSSIRFNVRMNNAGC